MPTATDRDSLDMRISDVRRIAHAGQDHHVVLLQRPAATDACQSGSDTNTPLSWPFASSATARSCPGRSAPT
jgi:hypothetical protein